MTNASKKPKGKLKQGHFIGGNITSKKRHVLG